MSRRPTRFALASLTATALALAGGGCAQDFPPFNRLDSLRVLGIQSEPAAPLTGETSTITPLVFTPTPEPDPSLSYAWRWCPLPGPAETGPKCLITEEELAGLLGPDIQFPSFNLGTDPTASLPNALPAELLAAICTGVAPNVPRPNCTGGFPVQVALTVQTDTDKVEAVVTVKWRFDPAQAPNANPVVDGLTATLAGGEPQALPPADMLADDTIALPRKVGTRVNVLAAPETSESYQGLDDDGMPADLSERLFITWFIETGGTDDNRTSYIPERTQFDAMLKNIWSPQESRLYQQDRARIYVVLHDNRGGVGWRSGIVHLEPTP